VEKQETLEEEMAEHSNEENSKQGQKRAEDTRVGETKIDIVLKELLCRRLTINQAAEVLHSSPSTISSLMNG
jgi:hypothetical protein